MTRSSQRGRLASMTAGPGGISEKQLRTLYVDRGLSKKAIAREFGCSDTTVAAAVRYFRLSRREEVKVSDDELRLIVHLYTVDRLPVRVIAGRTAASRDKVLDTLRAAGVPLRGRGARTAEHLDLEQVRQAYEAGASLRNLARAARTDDGVIRDRLVSAGVSVRSQGRIAKWRDVLTPEFLRQKYVEEQQSLAQIAQDVGCAYQTVLVAVHRHGIDLRGSTRHRRQSS